MFPDSFSNQFVLFVVQLSISVFLVISILSFIVRPISPTKFSISVLKSIFKLSFIFSHIIYQHSVSVIFVTFEFAVVLILLSVFQGQGTFLLFTFGKKSLKLIKIAVLNAFSVLKIVLESSLICKISLNIYTLTVGFTFFNLALKIVSVWMNNSSEPLIRG